MRGLLTVSVWIPASKVGPEMSAQCQMENWNSWPLSYFCEHSDILLHWIKTFCKTGMHWDLLLWAWESSCDLCTSYFHVLCQTFIIWTQLLCHFSLPLLLQSWWRPATPKTAAKQLQLSLFFQLIYRIKSSLPLPAGSQCVESTMLVLGCCGWALTPLCPHPDLWEIGKVRRPWESWESRIGNRKSRGIRGSCSCKAWK